ncbi:hypothetical protein C5167_033202 [Papaver somniferum]|uniref:Uncharacterized protein n=1 Tax=Papaver somniferum TaxID=3469 RepID=A0A4Y7KDM7_PAPSO|nr:hypothetical protein C5167_033202 [Papaver somniferum]
MDSSASVITLDSVVTMDVDQSTPASTPATVVLLGRTSGIIYPIGVVTCTLVEEYLDFAY